MKQRRGLAAVTRADGACRRALGGALIAVAILAGPPAALAGTLQDERSQADFVSMDYPALSRSVSVDRPAWAAEAVSVDGPVVWAVALLPLGVRSWHDRLLAGSRQAQLRLFAVAEDAVSRHYAGQSPDYRAHQLESVRSRLELLVDREDFIRIETAERPDAVWMRLGYPASKIERALGFALPGAAPLPEHPRLAPATVPLAPAIAPHSGWDYVWEVTWLASVAAVTVLVTGVALAMGH